MHHVSRTIALAVLMPAALALSACAGGASLTPAAAGVSGAHPAQRISQASRLTILGVKPDASPTCDTAKFPGGCYIFSLHNGLDLHWCYGFPSDPCGETAEVSGWSGGVCKAKSACARPLRSIKVTWTGPIACSPSQCSGSYEDDSMVKGKKPPNKTKGYDYEQIISACIDTGGCGVLTTIGIRILK